MKNTVFYILLVFALLAFTQDTNCDGNCLHGYGTYNFSNNDTYEGQWANRNNTGKMEGYGKYIFSNGDKYQGQFLNNMPHGLGKMIYKNDNIFQGTFVNGVISGFGIFYSSEKRM